MEIIDVILNPGPPALGGRERQMRRRDNRFYDGSRLRSLAMTAVALLTSCAAPPVDSIPPVTPAAILLPASKAGIIDGRGRFREIYCAVRADHTARLPYDRPCEDNSALWRLPDEPPPTHKPVPLGPSTSGFRVVMVPGLLAECVAETSTAFNDGIANLEQQGYKTGYIQTRGRQGSDTNARIIRDTIMAMADASRIILVSHSKGTVDSLVALDRYPELSNRVAALISVSGAVNGSPLADIIPSSLASVIERLNMPSCPPGQGNAAADSLRRSVRLAWLGAHDLPRGVRFYSLAAFTGSSGMSAILQPFHQILSRVEPLNDGLVIASDAVIPGSTLLGYPNADHLAVAMPFTGNHPVLAATLVTRNDYPRAALLEAAVRYVDEDLSAQGQSAGAKPAVRPAPARRP
jgi:hypothetical protein